MKVLIRLFLLALLIALVFGAWKAAPMLEVGTGYLGKMMCSEHFVAGRKDLDAVFQDVVSVNSTFAHLEYEIDPDRQWVTTWAGPHFSETTVVYRPGLGCTIAAGVEPGELAPLSGESLRQAQIAYRNLREPAKREPSPALEDVLDQAFAEPFDGSQRNTRAIVVLHRGEIVAERYADGFDEGSPMIGWSMSKSITNNLVGILVADGLLDPDAPAPVEAWSDPSDVRHAITLRHLLQMSSGLDFEEVYDSGSDATQMLFTEYSAGLYAAQSGLAYPPGTHWYYSSGTSNILAHIVFEKTGGSAESTWLFMQQRLFGPLGLSSMVLEPDAGGAPVGSSYTYATARDWARLGQFWLQDGVWQGQRILPEGWMEWSASPAPAAPRGEYGAQFWMDAGRDGRDRDWPELPANLYFANGYNGQSVVVFPDEEIVVVRLGLTTDESWSLGEFLHGVYQALMPDQ